MYQVQAYNPKLTDSMRMRRLAKRFKASMSYGYAYKIPDYIADAIPDDQVDEFFRQCELLGLHKNRHGCWELS